VPKSKKLGESLGFGHSVDFIPGTASAKPSPVRLAERLPAPETVSVPAWPAPTVIGLKVTMIEQLAPAASVVDGQSVL
jgi:hypothetical protein